MHHDKAVIRFTAVTASKQRIAFPFLFFLSLSGFYSWGKPYPPLLWLTNMAITNLAILAFD